MRRKIICAMLACMMLAAIGTVQVFADTFLSPEPFEIWSEDGTMVFRWTPDQPDMHTAQATMYRNGEPVYIMENLPTMGVGEWNFFFSQDFRHFVFIPATGFSVAMEFYTDGELVKTYYIDNFIKDMNGLTRTVTTLHWRGLFPDRRSNPEHITERDVLRIITREQIVYEIDLTTGAILGYASYNASNRTPERTTGHAIRVWLNGQEISFPDQSPVIVNGRTLVPARGVFEAMGFTVDWDGDTSTVTLNDGRTDIVIPIGRSYFIIIRDVNTFDLAETVIALEVPAQIIGGRTMIPLRAISEAVGAEVDWVASFWSVIITTN